MTAPKTQKAEAENATSAPGRPGIVIAILFLIFFLGSSDNQMISPLLPRIAAEFGLKEGEVGRLIGPAYALAPPHAGALGTDDPRGARAVPGRHVGFLRSEQNRAAAVIARRKLLWLSPLGRSPYNRALLEGPRWPITICANGLPPWSAPGN